jgi:hypothetical protein
MQTVVDDSDDDVVLFTSAKRRKISDIQENTSPTPPAKKFSSQTELTDLTEPQVFYRLNHIPGLPASGNEGCVKIDQIFTRGATRAILTTYKLDLEWLAAQCPDILTVPTEVLHGEANLDIPQSALPQTLRIRCVKPSVAYGVFHGKIFVIGP